MATDEWATAGGSEELDLGSAYSDDPDHPWAYQQQRQFHGSTARFRAFVGSVGSGKTCAGMHEAFFKSAEPRTFGLVCSPTYPMLTKTVMVWMDQLRERWPGYACTYHKAERRLLFSNGSTIWFGYAADPDSLRGPNLNWFWLDEGALVGEKTFQVLQGRIRRRGYQGGWITTTPKGRNWVWGNFVDKQRPDYWMVRARLEDNPGLSEEYIRSLRESSPGAWGRQELDAEFVAFEGLIYQDFSDTRHIARTPPRERWRRVVAGLDFGFAGPGAIAVLVEDDEGRVTVVHEEYARNLAISNGPGDDWATRCLDICKEYPVEAFWCDPAEPRSISDLRRAGVNAKKANNDVLGRIRKLSALIAKDKFRSAPECVNFRAEMAGYCWEKDRDGKPRENERPEKGSDHLPDAAGYGVMALQRVGATVAKKPGRW